MVINLRKSFIITVLCKTAVFFICDMQAKDSNKSNALTPILQSHLGGKMNLARIKLISHVILALSKVQTVTLEKLANAFDSPIEVSSSFRRLQRFISTLRIGFELGGQAYFQSFTS